ncbi:hypothetical protein M8J75_016406 [Diaphorina citri]|nr:hypothetical protein M8J75_016406 [Diaphorina citri]KAI5747203.1 hypothetical protein M8J77_012261 [Diaphorina citri]
MSFQSSESALNSQSKPPPPPPFHPLSMSQIPPPPMLPVEPIHTDSSSTKENIPYVNKQDLYNIVYRDVLRKCDILNIGCYENKVWMNPVYPCLQVGPTCGLAVICMLANSMGKQLQLADLLFVSQACGFTKQGEMFSVANLKSLCNQVLGSNQLIIHHGTQGLEKDRKFIADHLKTGAVAFIPYDADYNHDPCLKHGLKAHWALIFGLLEPEDEDEVYLLARQGKSNHIGVWRYSDLSASNANLREIDPKRNIEDYLLPPGGIQEGLCNQYLLLRKV